MTSILDLRIEHRELEEQAATLLRVVQNLVPDPAAVAMLRWRMAQKLSDHCVREDRVVYEQLVASGDASATAVAWRYRQEHGQLAPDFSRYIGAWPVDRVASEWAAFRAETEAMVMHLNSRIFLEEQVLYAHVERLAQRRAAA
ncbi:hemerythrin domain-containing protein [Sphingomonas sp. JC676]|uniref:hemerythrin domain-containing protein n=1 Tax=Sphingomonas sp. JC676 TaxID=2768065 RepID=UPI0016586F9A|nr:hemerythrin domain-containing protein [Sphingomonas sp. JC676]MBC9033192.1 hemerythrin domain-containing protein [Sphingomonas sp. JC676]